MSKLKEERQNTTMLGQMGRLTKNLFKKGFNFIKDAVTYLAFSDIPSMVFGFLEDLIYNKNRDKHKTI